MVDFVLEDDLDIKIVESQVLSEVAGDTTVINAFFTDARVGQSRGYWLDIKSSELWIYDQSRLTSEVVNELAESAKSIAKELVDDGLYQRIDTDVSIDDTVITLYIKCYDDNRVVVDRKFSI